MFYAVCKRKDHSEGMCFRVIGYPPGYKGKMKPLVKQGTSIMGETSWDILPKQANMTVHDSISKKKVFAQYRRGDSTSS